MFYGIAILGGCLMHFLFKDLDQETIFRQRMDEQHEICSGGYWYSWENECESLIELKWVGKQE